MTCAGLKGQMEPLAAAMALPLDGEVVRRRLTRPSAGTVQGSVHGWGRYHRQARQLPPDQRRVLIEVGEAIKRSFQLGLAAVRAVQIEGHADYDTPRNLQRERQISVERDEAAATWGWEQLCSKAEIVAPRMMNGRGLLKSDFAKSHFGEIA
jgi:hypothetical protein